MKTFTIGALFFLLLSACATSTKFPVSKITPAASITVKQQVDKNKNTKIFLTAENLASPERIAADKKVYVVWIVTASNGTKNLGQLKNENAKRATLKTLTPFSPLEIYVSAEKEGNITFPSGIEIARLSLREKN